MGFIFPVSGRLPASEWACKIMQNLVSKEKLPTWCSNIVFYGAELKTQVDVWGLGFWKIAKKLTKFCRLPATEKTPKMNLISDSKEILSLQSSQISFYFAKKSIWYQSKF